MKNSLYLPALAAIGLLGCMEPSTPIQPSPENPGSSDVIKKNETAGGGLQEGDKVETIDQAAIDAMRQDILNNGTYKPVSETHARGLSKTSAAGGATMAFPMKDPRAACPGGYVYYYQDDEDTGTKSQMELYQDDVTSFTIQTKIDYATLIPFLSAGGLEFPRIRRNNGTVEATRRDTQITFCREWVDYLPQNTKNPYIVVSADGNCPINAYKYVRYLDNEDNHNASFVEPTDLPGIKVTSGGNSQLTLCFVPRNPYWTHVLPKPYADKYWFFTNASSANYRGSQYMDNEDDKNANSWPNKGDATMFPTVKMIMGDGVNTRWYFAGLDDGYAPLIFLTKHSARYAAQLTCANTRDAAYSAANTKALGTAWTTAVATTQQDWTALKGTATGWIEYAAAFLNNNTAYDNCMSQAGLIVE
jgi:hypothetical protein